VLMKNLRWLGPYLVIVGLGVVGYLVSSSLPIQQRASVWIVLWGVYAVALYGYYIIKDDHDFKRTYSR